MNFKHNVNRILTLVLAFIMIFQPVVSVFAAVVDVAGRDPGATYEILPPDSETFTGSSLKLLDGGEFGEMANFGLIAFDQLDLQAHTNSNFAAKNVNMTQASGTNNLQEGELFYIQNSITGGNNFNLTKGANGGGEWNGSQIVLGSGINVTGIDSPEGTTAWKFFVDGNQYSINGPKLEDNAIRQETAGQKFIDLDAYRSKAVELSQEFSEFTSTKISKQEGSESTIIERNDATIASYQVDAADLTKKIVVNDDAVDGRDHVFIISVDAAGVEEVKIPGLTITSSGYTGEVSEWTRGNVILNIYDSSKPDKQYRGNVTAEGLISASIICPYASFSTASNVNGQIIADKIMIGGEFHRDSITFTNEITIKGGLKAAKELNGDRDLEEFVFDFKLTGLDGAPMPDGAASPMMVQSELDGLILFGYITFEEPGEYKYELEEIIPEGAILLPDGRKFKDGIVYDTSKYTIGVVSNYRSATDRTLVIESYNIYDEKGNKIDSFDYDAGKTGVVTFKNNQSDGKAEIKAEKSFAGWNSGSMADKTFNIILECKSFVDKNGVEQWSGTGAQYKLPTTEQGQQWQAGSKTKTVEVSASAPIADFGKLSFVDQNGNADDNNLGTYQYVIKEQIPDGASYSTDGKTAVKDGIVYDAEEHIVTIVFSKIEDKYLVTTSYDDGKSSAMISNDLDQIKVEKKWFTNGVDVTKDTEGTISYNLMKKYTPYNPSKKVKVVAGNDQNNFTVQYEGMIEQGATIAITSDGNPEVRTYPSDKSWDYWPYYTDLDVSEGHCVISDISQIKDIIAVKGNNVTVSIEGPQQGTSEDVPNDAEVGTFELTNEDDWARIHTDLPITGVEDGKNYLYSYYVVEEVPQGYTATYENNDGINTGTITIKNSNEEEADKANLKVKKTFSDNTLTDDEKNKVEFEVTGPNNFSKTNTYDKFTDGVWDLGEVAPGEYTVTESNADKNGYTRTTTYKVDGDTTQEARATLNANDDITIELINSYEENTDERVVHGRVDIQKLDKEGKGLSGATFTLYNGSDVVKTYTGEAFYITTEDTDLADLLPTEDNESVTLQLVETEAPDGYELDDDPHQVVITTSINTEYDASTNKNVTVTQYTVKIDSADSADIINTKKTGEETKHDNITITKKDQDGEVLEGAEFKLYADEAGDAEINTYTDSKFTISTEDELLGDFLPAEDGGEVTLYLRETKAPEGYEMDTADHKVVIRTSITEAYDRDKDAFVTTTKYTMTIDGKSEIDITNDEKTDRDRVDDSVTVKKIDDITGQEITGAIFKLYKDEACTEEIKSYQGGTFEVSTSDTQLGNYLPIPDDDSVTLYLKETKAPAGYELYGHVYRIVITAHDSTEYDSEIDANVTTTTYTMKIDGADSFSVPNTEKHGERIEDDDVTITKKDQDGKSLSGAEFTIYSDAECTNVLDKRAGGEFLISTEDANLQDILPAADSQVTIYLKETKAPDGYDMDKTVHPIVISASESKAYDATVDKYITTKTYSMTIDGESEIDITNTKKTGEKTKHASVVISKKDASDNSDLEGATFGLYTDEDALNKIAEYEGGEFEISTEDDGLAQYLPKGEENPVTLYLKETQAPDGYYPDSTPHPVTISKTVTTEYDSEEDAYVTVTEYSMTIDGKSTRDIANMRNVTDEVIDDKVEITKKDQDGEELSGATFGLYDNNDREITTFNDTSFQITSNYLIDTLVGTDEHMNDGDEITFKLKELEAPQGYDIDKEEHIITLKLDVTPQRLVPEKKAFVTTYKYTLKIDGKSEIDIINTKKTDTETKHDNITITKKDQDGEVLKGAEFKLYADEAGETEINTYTDSKFTISTEDELLGDFLPAEDGGEVTLYLKETKAPEGYEMDTADHKVVISTSISEAYDEEKDAFVTTTKYSMTIDDKSEIDIINTKDKDEEDDEEEDEDKESKKTKKKERKETEDDEDTAGKLVKTGDSSDLLIPVLVLLIACQLLILTVIGYSRYRKDRE